MEQIILKKDYLELIKWKRKLILVKDINKDELLSELDDSLDVLKKVGDLMKNLKGKGYDINVKDYDNYLDFLESEKYEELEKYTIV